MPAPQVVIDLTENTSDEEDTRSTVNQPRFFHKPTTGASFFAHAPASNHGLPTIANSRTDLWASTAHLGTNYLLDGTAGSSLRQDVKLEYQGPFGSQRPQLGSPVYNMEDANPKNYKNTMVPSHGRAKRQKTAHQAELPNAPHPSQVRHQEYDETNHRQSGTTAGSQTTRKTIITGASRAAASKGITRLSREGAIQKPKEGQDNSCDPRMSKAIARQVIPHVSAAMIPYKSQLQPAERREMGSRVAAELVSVKSFREDLGDGDTLSYEYEMYVVKKAEQLAAKYFNKEHTKKRIALPPQASSENPGYDRPRGVSLRKVHNGSETNRMNSEVSTDAEEVFDHRPIGQANNLLSSVRSRGNSFSPATSFSNDALDSRSPPEGDDGIYDLADGTRSLPKRSSRAIQPIYAKPKRTRAKRKHNWENQKAVVPASHPMLIVRDDEMSEHVSEDEFPPSRSLSLPPLQIVALSAKTKQTNSQYKPALFRPAPKILQDPLGQLLRQRELDGMTPVRARSGQSSFKAVASSYFEDCFVRQSEWTDCSGTILSLTWTSPKAFICGAVAHSDCNHMQYNKPGNLLLGSIPNDTLRAFPDHRMVRPIVSATENASNALEAMRQTQDPWMYAPVVSTAYSEFSGLTFTASFDKTVKVWSVAEDGASMTLRGTWLHEDRVNFVAASKHHDRIATASESMSDAVRVYNLDEEAISHSAYDQYCGNKASSQAEEIRRREKWAYYPSTIQWGLAEPVKYLLLVGWSPRSNSGDESDIPEDKINTGELCLWNSLDSSRVPINSAHFQNVFEVIWHPTQPFFLAATSPSGTYDVDTTKTQVRLFGLNATGGFINIKTFDCPALDVNELTIMPTSRDDCFVTVSCTDSCTYVYDSKRGDQPIHVLQHGDSLDELENEDSGVKFASWGNSSDRFYTGSSDGELVAWDLKAPPGEAFVRSVLKLSGGIYAGSFSADFSKLIIGDDTGKVHLLAIDDSDLEDHRRPKVRMAHQLARTSNALLPSSIKRPKLIIPHAEPLHPNGASMQNVEQSSAEIANQYLEENQLQLLPNDQFPMARRAIFQGPNYNETLLYRFEAHEDNDSTKPLLPNFLHNQQFLQDEADKYCEEGRQKEAIERRLRAIRPPPSVILGQRAHRANLGLDLCFKKLSLSTQVSLQEERIEFEGDFIFDYEIMPSKRHLFLGD